MCQGAKAILAEDGVARGAKLPMRVSGMSDNAGPAALQRSGVGVTRFAWVFALAFAVAMVGACGNEGEVPMAKTPAVESAQSVAAHVAPANMQPTVVVYKNASCGCCGAWVEHMQSHGFPVEVHDVDDLNSINERVGLPPAMASCHTAEVGGYFIEGHVPATEVQRLLAEKPKAKGLTVPGMPIGSPGMEQGDVVDRYDVLLVNEDGTTGVYATYPKQ
jgi:hypothetical protein